MTRYRTIVADPPWHYDAFATQSRSPGRGWEGKTNYLKPLPYASMTLGEIRALPVGEMADRDARCFLWTTNRYLPDAFGVLAAWGFRYAQTLVWHKIDANLGGGIAPNCFEFVLVGNRGVPGRIGRAATALITTSAPKQHSRKPDVFLDMVESVSPGPYLELFARRQRLGWDTWGNEALDHTGGALALCEHRDLEEAGCTCTEPGGCVGSCPWSRSGQYRDKGEAT